MGREDVLALLKDHRDEIQTFGVESLRLFGSVARGEASTDSDVDLLVRFRETPKDVPSLLVRAREMIEDERDSSDGLSAFDR